MTQKSNKSSLITWFSVI